MLSIEEPDVFPVPTGMNRLIDFAYPKTLRVPRTHGDEPIYLICSLERSVCSPYPRG